MTPTEEDDPFDFFISSTNIRWCYYHETQRILGNTFGMLVLQDFEAITPNLLARTIETIEGGGIVVLLLSSLDSLQQLYTMSMDVHDRYRTEAHQDVICRFNERFILSLMTCKSALVLDDKLNVIPVSSHSAKIEPLPAGDMISQTDLNPDLKELISSLAGVQPAASLVSLCKTMDQAKAVLKFIESLSEKTLRSTVSLTASRGRGKSAALGLAIAGAVGFKYTNILVTSPSPENLKTLFEFVLKGLDAIHLQEHLDFEVIRSTDSDHNKSIVRINLFKDHKQSIQYIHPDDVRKNKLTTHAAELVVIDEAAAIPLPIVKSLLGPYLVFMASTINGYEGTGRSLSLKLLQQLRTQAKNQKPGEATSSSLAEITLEESIRYKSGDQVEKWLNNLLCLDGDYSFEKTAGSGCPDPSECQLYYINRDTLFSFHETSESFLQRLMSLYVASHYKNSPNDLQMMSDAPAHHLFCLLPPMKESAKTKGKLPQILCFIQVCLEGEISSETITNSLSRGKRASGDLIPWTISQQFQDSKFPSLSGARIIRIATNPSYQGMGYGSIAIKLLEEYYSGKIDVIPKDPIASVAEEKTGDDKMEIGVKKSLPPLLSNLNERKPEILDYMGVSFGLTSELFKFWMRNGYIPVYIRQTSNELTGEHSCIVLKMITSDDHENSHHHVTNQWLEDFSIDFQRRFVSLLSFSFRSLNSTLALSVLNSGLKFSGSEKIKELTKSELEYQLSPYDLKRLELYSQNLVDYHLITDLLPMIARLFFTRRFSPDFNLSAVQMVLLLNIGLQHKTVEEIESDLQLPSSQILGLFNRAIRKLTNYLKKIEEKSIESKIKLPERKDVNKVQLVPMVQGLDEELEEEATKIERKEKKEFKKMTKEFKNLEKYSIKGNEDDWDQMLTGKPKTIVSIKSIQPKRPAADDADHQQKKKKKKFWKKGDNSKNKRKSL